MIDERSLRNLYQKTAYALCLSPEYLLWEARRSFRKARRKTRICLFPLLKFNLFKKPPVWEQDEFLNAAIAGIIDSDGKAHHYGRFPNARLEPSWLRLYPRVALGETGRYAITKIDGRYFLLGSERELLVFEILRAQGRILSESVLSSESPTPIPQARGESGCSTRRSVENIVQKEGERRLAI